MSPASLQVWRGLGWVIHLTMVSRSPMNRFDGLGGPPALVKTVSASVQGHLHLPTEGGPKLQGGV